MASITSLTAEGVSNQKYTTENSTYLTRPGLKAFLQPDTNAGNTDVTSFNEKVNFLKQHVPTATGQPNYDIVCCDDKLENGVPLALNPKKRNDIRIVDPITGFVSVCGEVISNTGRNGLGSFGKARVEPQTTIPKNIHSIRQQNEAINELK